MTFLWLIQPRNLTYSGLGLPTSTETVLHKYITLVSEPSASRRPEMVLGSLGLVSQMVLRCHGDAGGTERGSSGKAASALSI